jgi:hypothetical protein
MRLNPGDKVWVIEDLYENSEYMVSLVATEGSVGTILSLEAYQAFLEQRHPGMPAETCAELVAFVQREMQSGKMYPVQFETVTPPGERVRVYWETRGSMPHLLCEVGDVQVLNAASLRTD